MSLSFVNDNTAALYFALVLQMAYKHGVMEH